MKRLLVTLLLVVVAGCSAAASDDGFLLDEGSIVGPDVLQPGLNEMQISNVGEFNHTMLVTDPEGNVMAATDVLAPGTSTVLTVDLAEGSYQVSCRLVGQDSEGNIIDHYEQGMFKQLEVGG